MSKENIFVLAICLLAAVCITGFMVWINVQARETYSYETYKGLVRDLPEGTIVVCWSCGKPLYKTTTDIFSNGAVCAADFQPINKSIPQPINGEQILYPLCGSEIFDPGINGPRIRTITGEVWP